MATEEETSAAGDDDGGEIGGTKGAEPSFSDLTLTYVQHKVSTLIHDNLVTNVFYVSPLYILIRNLCSLSAVTNKFHFTTITKVLTPSHCFP